MFEIEVAVQHPGSVAIMYVVVENVVNLKVKRSTQFFDSCIFIGDDAYINDFFKER